MPFFIEVLPDAGVDVPDPHAYLRELRAFLNRRTGDAILLGEVNLPHADQRRFIGDEDGDELTMIFDFIGMQHMYLALARSRRGRSSRPPRPPPSRSRRSGPRSSATTTSSPSTS